MEDIERIKDRLDNIRGVEPIITSLRTIAAGGWRIALRRVQATGWYLENLQEVLRTLLPRVPSSYLTEALVVPVATPRRPLMLVIASERGLAGAFNDIVLLGAERLIAQQQIRSDQVHVATLGSRAETYFVRHGRPPLMARDLPVTRVATLGMVRALGHELVDLLRQGEVDGVYAVYSPYRATTTEPPISRLWLPIEAGSLPEQGEEAPAWPPPIVETEPAVLFRHTIEEWLLASLFQCVMESAASEQAARFRAMDNASSNLTRLIEELTLSYHTARQHAITMEMLDLVAGAGILRGPGSSRR